MANQLSTDIVFLAAKRTAFGTFNGTLEKLSATDLGEHASRAALEQSGVSVDDVDHVYFGNVMQTAADAIYLPRHIGLKVGIPQSVPAVGVNRLCGSGFEAVTGGAREILCGDAEVVLVGGTESMSQAPHIVRGARKGYPLGRAPAFEDSLWSCLTDSYTGFPMAITAENLAEQYDISRDACDEYALRSQQTWANAQEKGYFKDEIAPIEIKSRRGVTEFSVDEHARGDASMEGMGKLRPVFKKDGVVTAGNASGICDGAAAMVISSAQYAEKKGLNPLGRLVNWGVSGCDPTIMGIGPVPAARIALERAGLSLSDIDLFEVVSLE